MIHENTGYGYDIIMVMVIYMFLLGSIYFSLLVLCVSFPMLTELMFKSFLEQPFTSSATNDDIYIY